MSMGAESPQLPKLKKHKQTKDKIRDPDKSEKERKRPVSDNIDLTLPAKKHKSRNKPVPSIVPDSPSKNITEPVVSPFRLETFSLYLPLPPIAQGHAIGGLCAEFLSPLILTYYPPFHGTVVSYNNPRISTEAEAEGSKEAYARAIDEYAATFIWLTADFLLFKPQKTTVIEGYVNLQNESNIGMLCWNFFNASIERKRLPKDWRWIAGGINPPGRRKLKKAGKSVTTDSEDDEEVDEPPEEPQLDDAQGYFLDGHGKKIEGLLRFRVNDVETSRSMDREVGFFSIEGTMLGEVEEKELRRLEASRTAKGKEQRRSGNDPKDSTINNLTSKFDDSVEALSTKSLKHRAKY